MADDSLEAQLLGALSLPFPMLPGMRARSATYMQTQHRSCSCTGVAIG
jgi:hypothetical protein